MDSMDLPGLHLTSMGDALEEPPESVRWVWDGFLPSNGSSLLSSKPKVGKSTLARCLALSVSRGSPFLGAKTTQGPVVYVSLEDKRAETILHFRDLGARGTEPLLLSTETRIEDPARTMKSLVKAVKRTGAILVVIDTLIRFAPFGDINDYVQAKQMCLPFWQMCREQRCHVMLVHHCRKKAEGGPTDNQMGSQGIGGGVDTLIEVRKTKRGRSMWSEQRYGDDVKAMSLEMDKETRWVGTPEDRHKSYVLQVLSESNVPLDRANLKKLIKSDNRKINEALMSLVAHDLVVKSGTGKPGDPFRYMALTLPPPIGGSKTLRQVIYGTEKQPSQAQKAWLHLVNGVKTPVSAQAT